MIQAHCPQCGSDFTTDDTNAGRIARCACGAAVAVPGSGPSPVLPEMFNLPMVALVLSVMGVFVPLVAIAGILTGKVSIERIDRDGVMGRRLPGRMRAQAAVFFGRVAVWGWFAVLLAACAYTAAVNPCCKSARDMNAAQVRDMVKCLILWSAANTTTDDFPGATMRPWATTAPAADERAPVALPDNAKGTSTLDRTWALMATAAGCAMPAPKAMINPASTSDQPYLGDNYQLLGCMRPPDFTSQNTSYAFLDAGSSEWKDNTNAGAPLVCDKLVGKGSAWNKDLWQGHVGWGDAHVTFEATQIFSVVIEARKIAANNIWAGTTRDNLEMVNP